MTAHHIAIVVAAATILVHAASHATTLCNKGETDYFSCNAKNGKTISLCGHVIGNDDPWLQYRFGSRSKLELLYPPRKDNSLREFKAEKIRADGGKTRVDAIAFVSGGIGYSVEYVAPETGDPYTGVSTGDPKGFGMEGSKRRDKYPTTQIVCSPPARTKNFFELVNYLSD